MGTTQLFALQPTAAEAIPDNLQHNKPDNPNHVVLKPFTGRHYRKWGINIDRTRFALEEQIPVYEPNFKYCVLKNVVFKHSRCPVVKKNPHSCSQKLNHISIIDLT